MVTRGRAGFVLQSLRYFLEQDYPHKELLVVYEDEDDLPASIAEDERVRLLRVARGMSIGEKRNLGARAAHGEVVAQWDDDDWYGSSRLSAQVAPLLEGRADITGLYDAPLLMLSDWTFWRCPPEAHARVFVEDVLGGTLVYWRHVWERGARYPHTFLREDADFLVDALRQGARLHRVRASHLFVYLRHGGNTWRFHPAHEGWTRSAEPTSFRGARDFYRACVPPPTDRPRVSCIMPTSDRRRFVPRAIRHFLRQRYPDAELIIVDDGRHPVKDLVPTHERIRYIGLSERMPLGHKRNLACEAASGDILLHWDDDDWMGPQWISLQVSTLEGTGADVCGLSRPLFYEPALRRAFRYEYPVGARPWVHGGTLCYTRELWRRNPFPAITQGEDVAFLWSAQRKRVVAHEHFHEYVAHLHAQNTSARPRPGSYWKPYPVVDIERLFITALQEV